MPAAERAYEAITLEHAVWLDMVVEQQSRKEIAESTGTPYPTVRDRLTRLEDATGTGNQRELARWWLQHKKPWVQWWLDRLGMDPRELADDAVS